MSYVFSPEAIDDIFEIAAWLDQRSVQASIRLSNELIESCAWIAQHALLGKLRRVNPHKTVRVRLANPRYPYLVLYDPDATSIRILRVLHGARELNRLLKDL